MMKTACFIPIKANSERIPGKNLRILNGKNSMSISLNMLKRLMYSMMFILIQIVKRLLNMRRRWDFMRLSVNLSWL